MKAVIIGGGISGLLAARVLSSHFDEVLILERDFYPKDARPRKGVPQALQVHVLLARGYEILQGLFPRLGESLDGFGVFESDLGADTVMFVGDTQLPRRRLGIPIRCVGRALLEWVLRTEINGYRNIRIAQGQAVSGLLRDGESVCGVVAKVASKSILHSADLVVDASGRSSKLPIYLREFGVNSVYTEQVHAGFRYASCIFEQRDCTSADETVLVTAMARHPDFRNSGILMPLGDGTVLATLIVRRNTDYRLTQEQFVQNFYSLGTSYLHQRLLRARALSPIRHYADTANRRRHYQKIASWPGRLLALGDSVCQLNPRFGQGMTVASASAIALEKYICETGLGGLRTAPRRWSLGFLKRQNAVCRVPWYLAVTDDSNWVSQKSKSITTQIGVRYLRSITSLAAHDVYAHAQFMRVAHLMAPPWSLLNPRLALSAAAGASRR